VRHPTRVFAIANDGLAIPTDANLAPERARNRKSVAVLPFVNMSIEPENEFFSDGVTEEIINALTRVNGLKVTARTSSFAFKNHNDDIRDIARKLRVTHVLEGSVRRSGARVRVTAQLICAKDGYHLFSQTYDRSLDDIFGVQDEIAHTIVHELADHLGPVQVSESHRTLSQGHSHDTEAHAEYLRGRFEWAQFTPASARRAIGYFNRSIQMDPDCALPHAGLATANVFLGAIGHSNPKDSFEHAEAAAMRALELEPDLGESHVALAAVKLFYRWDFDGAYHAFQKALSLTPGSAEVHHLYSMYLRAVGDHEEAAEESRIALQLDPLSLQYRNALAQCLGMSGHLDEAFEEVRHVIREDPRFRAATETLGWCHVLDGDYELAAKAFERLPELAASEFAGAAPRGYAYATLGRSLDAERMKALLERRSVEQPDVHLQMDFAVIHEGLGEHEEALARLHRAVDLRLGSMIFFHSFVPWRHARSDPRFQDLLERVGIPQLAPVP
jgi:TolB-like protein/tetratricopeptide (TPR) repeat protein